MSDQAAPVPPVPGTRPRGVDGSDQVWSITGTLVAGPVAWAAIGFGVDQFAHTGVLAAVGVGFGFVASLILVWHQDRRSQPR